MYSFTAMEAIRIPTTTGLKVTSSGWKIFSTELLPSSTPISKITMDTTSPDTYSMRPWPKGWWLSGFWAASLKPRRVTTEEPASERLLKASAVMAMDPLRSPARNFPTNSSRFNAMPTAPHSTP